MPTIAIIGAAGHIGHAAAQAFLDAGWAVKGVGRGARLKELPSGVEPVAGDAYDAASLVASTRGADVILHAANPAYDKWETTVLPMVENAIAAAKANGATLLIPGNVYNFGLEIGMDAGEDAAQLQEQVGGLVQQAGGIGRRPQAHGDRPVLPELDAGAGVGLDKGQVEVIPRRSYIFSGGSGGKRGPGGPGGRPGLSLR